MTTRVAPETSSRSSTSSRPYLVHRHASAAQFHFLRETFVSILYALGNEMPYVMAQSDADSKVKPRDPRARLLSRRERERLRALVESSPIATRGSPWKAGVGSYGSGPACFSYSAARRRGPGGVRAGLSRRAPRADALLEPGVLD